MFFSPILHFIIFFNRTKKLLSQSPSNSNKTFIVNCFIKYTWKKKILQHSNEKNASKSKSLQMILSVVSRAVAIYLACVHLVKLPFYKVSDCRNETSQTDTYHQRKTVVVNTVELTAEDQFIKLSEEASSEGPQG